MKPSRLKSSRSKLETHIEILKVLALNGSSNLSKIMDKANINRSVLKESLGFLIKQSLVEEQIIEKPSNIYAVTERGTNVLKYFREIPQAIPVEKARGRRNPPNVS